MLWKNDIYVIFEWKSRKSRGPKKHRFLESVSAKSVLQKICWCSYTQWTHANQDTVFKKENKYGHKSRITFNLIWIYLNIIFSTNHFVRQYLEKRFENQIGTNSLANMPIAKTWDSNDNVLEVRTSKIVKKVSNFQIYSIIL